MREDPAASGFTPCAQFTDLTPRVLRVIPPKAFGGAQPTSLATLDDGSIVVGTDAGLYRIDPKGVLSPLWTHKDETAPDSWNELAPILSGVVGLLNDQWIVGVGIDGAVRFKQRPRFAIKSTWLPTFFRGRDGVVWIREWDQADPYSGGVAYAFEPGKGVGDDLPARLSMWSMFLGRDGRVYVSSKDGLFTIAGFPHVHVSFEHAPVLIQAPAQQFGIDGGPATAFSAVGPDGSIWASTYTQVVHVHADGTIRVLRIRRPLTALTTLPSALHCVIAPDGAAWLETYDEFVRITNDDRIQVVTLPPDPNQNNPVHIAFGPDGSIWYLSDSGDSTVVVHLAPSGE